VQASTSQSRHALDGHMMPSPPGDKVTNPYPQNPRPLRQKPSPRMTSLTTSELNCQVDIARTYVNRTGTIILPVMPSHSHSKNGVASARLCDANLTICRVLTRSSNEISRC
jgi:hypothetical protein